jgi:hypothetical protein
MVVFGLWVLSLFVVFGLGVFVARYWPRNILFSDYSLLRNETKRIESALAASATALHTRFDQVLAALRAKL